jgi:carbon-monoxide dehydrogenase medium subunit
MKPAPFQYARAGSVGEAVSLLGTQVTAARLLAGGQSLMPLLLRRLERPALLIDINRIPGLDRIEALPLHIQMGALVRQEQARRSVLVREEVPGLAAALGWVANPVIRQRGTVIGNLVTNAPGSELPAVALALQAQFVVRSAQGEEVRSAHDLLAADQGLPPHLMVTHVLWPRRPARAAFYEVARRDGHTPVVSALVTLTGTDCRVALSGVAATGLSCASVAQRIARRFPQVPEVAEIAAALGEDLKEPLHADAWTGARYRLEVAPVVIRRAAERMARSGESC